MKEKISKKANAKLNAEIPERVIAINDSLMVIDDSITKLREIQAMLQAANIRKNIDAVIMCNVIQIFFTEELPQKCKKLIDSYSKFL